MARLITEKRDTLTRLPFNFFKGYIRNSIMKKIDISTKKFPNMHTWVDDADFEWLNQWKWHPKKDASTFYAHRNVMVNGKQTKVQMHREITRATAGELVDHKFGNGLNNQRYNLRVCSQSQNQANRGVPVDNQSGYKGVHWNINSKKWLARIKLNGTIIHLGSFFCVIKAAKAYDRAALKHFGEFARINFPIGNQRGVEK